MSSENRRSRLLDALAGGRSAAPDVAALVVDADPVLAHAALVAVRDRVRAADPGFGPLVPADPTGRPPEIVELIAAIHLLEPPDAPLPHVSAVVPISTQAIWAAACLVRCGRWPAIAPALMFDAAECIPWATLRDPGPALSAVLGEPRAARAGVRGLVALGRSGRLGAAQVVPRLTRLLTGPHADLAAAGLAEPWSLGVPIDPASLEAALSGVAAAEAGEALAARGESRRLVEVLGDDARPVSAHDAALGAIGHRPLAGAIHAIVDRGLADPPRFASAALQALRRLRRRGGRIEERHVGPIVELAVHAPSVAAAVVGEVLDPQAAEAADALRARLGRPTSTRLIELLAALPPADSDAHLVALVDSREHDDAIDLWVRLLAARRARARCAAALHRCLARHPALVRGLHIDDPPSVVGPRARHRAALRRGETIPWATAVERGEVDAGVVAGLMALGDAGPDLMRWATAYGHPLRTMAIAALGRLAGPGARATLARGLADEDEDVATACVAALRMLGRRHPPTWPTSPDGPGSASLVAGIDRALADDPSPRVRAALLAHLAELRHEGLALTVRRDLRHADGAVRRGAVAALATAVEPAATAWLVSRGVPEDPRVARALFSALGRRADPVGCAALVAGLDHRLMNLKKTAADALRTAGDASAVPAVIRWLGRHDNPGFRAALLAALEAIAGDGLPGVVRGACDRAEAQGDGERVVRLCRVFDGRVPAAVLARWIDETPWGSRLGRLVFSGAVRPMDGADIRRRLGGSAAETPAAPDASSRREQARLAREALAAWDPDSAPDVVLAAIGHLAPRPPASMQLVDQACALFGHAEGADQLRLLDLVRGAGRLDARRRFRAIDALRRGARPENRPAALAAMAAFGGRPSDDARPRWLNHARREVREQAAAVDGPGEPLVGRRRARLARGEVGQVLVDAIERDESPAAVVDDLRRRHGPAAALEALCAAAEGDDWPAVLAAARAWPTGVRWLLDRSRPPDGAAATARSSHPTAARIRALHDAMAEGDLDAAAALARRGDPEAIERCLRAGRFTDVEPNAAWAAAIRRIELPEQRLEQLADRARGGVDDAVIAAVVRHLDRAPSASTCLRLRRWAFDRVWPHVAGRFTPAWLPALAPTRTPPGAIIAAFAAAEPADWPEFARWFAAAAVDGPVHAPGLRAILLAHPEQLSNDGWRLLCALVDGPAARAELVAALRAHTRPDAAARTLLDGLESQPAAVQIPLLSPWSTRPEVLDRLADLYAVADARTRRLLPAESLPRLVDRWVAALSGRRPERPRRALTALVELRPAGVPVIDLLAEALDHPDSTVQAHAHRLLGRNAPRARYLRETRRLLVDRDPAVMRRAIRVVCYGGDVGAVPRVVALLTRPERAVREAAVDGLVTLGVPALGALYRAHGAARPDRRPPIARVIDLIEADGESSMTQEGA